MEARGWLLGKIRKVAAGTVIASGGYQVFPWTNGTLINSYPDHITLIDSSGREVDRTPEAKDEENNNLCQARYPNGKDLGSDRIGNSRRLLPAHLMAEARPTFMQGNLLHYPSISRRDQRSSPGVAVGRVSLLWWRNFCTFTSFHHQAGKLESHCHS